MQISYVLAESVASPNVCPIVCQSWSTHSDREFPTEYEMSNLLISRPSILRQRSRRVAKWCAALKALFLMFASEKQRRLASHEFFFITEGEAFERTFSAFRGTPAGRALLRLRPNISEVYTSRGLTVACPPGSLGQWYVTFMTDFGSNRENLSQGRH